MDDQNFHYFWESITEFIIANTVADQNFRNVQVNEATVNRLEKQINEGNYTFDYADRHEIWIVFTNLMKKLENPIVPGNTAKIVRLCGIHSAMRYSVFSNIFNKLHF